MAAGALISRDRAQAGDHGDALASTLEATRQALAGGEISFEHAAAAADGTRRQAEPDEAEAQLLRTAKQADPRRVSQKAGRMTMQARPDQGELQDRRQYDRRGMLTRRTRDGMVFSEGQLHQLAGERLLAALSRDARPVGDDDPRTPAQRNADALCRWASRIVVQDPRLRRPHQGRTAPVTCPLSGGTDLR
ncbi:MAG TPA: DUF222 domain-containing protein [Nitriliruptorales bacterium]|nr:DUF222 domain-containing protein [Nitriliruptorales bacterium]